MVDDCTRKFPDQVCISLFRLNGEWSECRTYLHVSNQKGPLSTPDRKFKDLFYVLEYFFCVETVISFWLDRQRSKGSSHRGLPLSYDKSAIVLSCLWSAVGVSGSEIIDRPPRPLRHSSAGKWWSRCFYCSTANGGSFLPAGPSHISHKLIVCPTNFLSLIFCDALIFIRLNLVTPQEKTNKIDLISILIGIPVEFIKPHAWQQLKKTTPNRSDRLQFPGILLMAKLFVLQNKLHLVTSGYKGIISLK